MVALPPRPEQVLIKRVYDAIALEKARPELYLGRLGSSFIGEECVRKVWLDWRGFAREEFEGRMHRLFETGHLQEARIVEDLRRAGLEVFDKRTDGSQFEFTDETGHFISKVDGIAKGMPGSEHTPHVLEIKTHNKNSFSGLVKNGVQEAKPLHYAQVQISMALGGFTRALYVAVCKDDEQFYVERVKEDKPAQKVLVNKIIKLTEARLTPAGIIDDGSSFGCKFCNLKAVCTRQAQPLRHCRTCSLCEPVGGGGWYCTLQDKSLNTDEQRAACAEYEALC